MDACGPHHYFEQLRETSFSAQQTQDTSCDFTQPRLRATVISPLCGRPMEVRARCGQPKKPDNQVSEMLRAVGADHTAWPVGPMAARRTGGAGALRPRAVFPWSLTWQLTEAFFLYLYNPKASC